MVKDIFSSKGIIFIVHYYEQHNEKQFVRYKIMQKQHIEDATNVSPGTSEVQYYIMFTTNHFLS